jgi:hypothetical protein
VSRALALACREVNHGRIFDTATPKRTLGRAQLEISDLDVVVAEKSDSIRQSLEEMLRLDLALPNSASSFFHVCVLLFFLHL